MTHAEPIQPPKPAAGLINLQALWLGCEAPTWLVTIAIYGGWLALTWYVQALPWWVAVFGIAALTCWHGSLQHETVHGHPTKSATINDEIGMLPLGLWIPYHTYRRTHLHHHQVSELTDPATDPESFYVTSRRWLVMPMLARWLLTVNNSLLGRLTVGPAITLSRFWYQELGALLTGDRRQFLREWTGHLVLSAAVLYWVVMVCGIPLWLYTLGCYIGLSITLQRSFTEHRPAAHQDARSIIVEASWFWRLMYLGNNFHALHHHCPGTPWFHLSKIYDDSREEFINCTENFVFHGYSDVFRRYILRLKDTPVHPSTTD